MLTLRPTAEVIKLCKIQKVVNFTHFNQKTHTLVLAKLCIYTKVL